MNNCEKAGIKMSSNAKRTITNARKPTGFWGSRIISSMNVHHNSLTDWGLGHVSIEPQFHILDVGCGGGNALSKMSNMAPEGKLCGIDHSEVSVKESKKKNKEDVISGKIEIKYGSVSDLPYDDDSFDLVTGIETYYFWPDPIEDLKEVKRTLKPNGSILLIFEARSDNNPEIWKDYRDIVDMHIPSEKGIREELEKAGFSDIVVDTKDDWLCAVGKK